MRHAAVTARSQKHLGHGRPWYCKRFCFSLSLWGTRAVRDAVLCAVVGPSHVQPDAPLPESCPTGCATARRKKQVDIGIAIATIETAQDVYSFFHPVWQEHPSALIIVPSHLSHCRIRDFLRSSWLSPCRFLQRMSFRSGLTMAPATRGSG